MDCLYPLCPTCCSPCLISWDDKDLVLLRDRRARQVHRSPGASHLLCLQNSVLCIKTERKVQSLYFGLSAGAQGRMSVQIPQTTKLLKNPRTGSSESDSRAEGFTHLISEIGGQDKEPIWALDDLILKNSSCCVKEGTERGGHFKDRLWLILNYGCCRAKEMGWSLIMTLAFPQRPSRQQGRVSFASSKSLMENYWFWNLL